MLTTLRYITTLFGVTDINELNQRNLLLSPSIE